MTKRLTNTSYYHTNTNTIHWRLQLIFINNPQFQIAELFRIHSTSVTSSESNQRVSFQVINGVNSTGITGSTGVAGGLIECMLMSVKETQSIDEILDELLNAEMVSQTLLLVLLLLVLLLLLLLAFHCD